MFVYLGSTHARPSGDHEWGLHGDRGVGGAVAEHGPQDVKAAPGHGEHGLDVGLAFTAFAVEVGAGGGAAFQGRESGEVEHAQKPAVVAAGAVVVASDPARVSGCGGEPGDAGEPVGGLEDGEVSAGREEELGGEDGSEPWHSQEHLGGVLGFRGVDGGLGDRGGGAGAVFLQPGMQPGLVGAADFVRGAVLVSSSRAALERL